MDLGVHGGDLCLVDRMVRRHGVISGDTCSDSWRGWKYLRVMLGGGGCLPLDLAGNSSGEGSVQELLGQSPGGVSEMLDRTFKGVSQGEPFMIFGA
jgi:hypothetical protein